MTDCNKPVIASVAKQSGFHPSKGEKKRQVKELGIPPSVSSPPKKRGRKRLAELYFRRIL